VTPVQWLMALILSDDASYSPIGVPIPSQESPERNTRVETTMPVKYYNMWKWKKLMLLWMRFGLVDTLLLSLSLPMF